MCVCVFSLAQGYNHVAFWFKSFIQVNGMLSVMAIIEGNGICDEFKSSFMHKLVLFRQPVSEKEKSEFLLVRYIKMNGSEISL